MELTLFVFISFLQLIKSSSIIQKGENSSQCESRSVNELAYFGWPFKVDFNTYYQKFDYTDMDYDYYTDADKKIVISILNEENDQILFNKSFFLEILITEDVFYYFEKDPQPGDSAYYLIEYVIPSNETEAECFEVKLHLNMSHLPDITCKEALAKDTHLVLKSDGALTQKKEFKCDTPHQEPPRDQVHHINKNHTYTSQWLKNCAPIPINQSNAFQFRNDVLIIPQTTHRHPGVYSCKITYNDMTRYIVHRNFCILPQKRHDSQLTLKCYKDVYLSRFGEDLHLECTGTGVEGLGKHELTVVWSKQKEVKGNETMFQCINQIASEISNGSKNNRLECFFNFTNVPDCLYDVKSLEELNQLATKKIKLFFTIRNITQSDLGFYTATLHRGKDSVVANITILADVTPTLFKNARAIGVGVGIFVFFLLMIAVFVWNRVFVIVHYKRFFAQPEQDIKSYGAFLSYHFSTTSDKFLQQIIRDSVTTTREVLEMLGYKVFDEHHEAFDNTLRAENAVNSMQQCHRVVIMLTSEYIKDRWSIFKLQKSFQSMIESESKIIFILVPGILEYIKQHSSHNSACKLVRRAIKLNYSIKWSDHKNFNLSRFQLEMEYAMPKLKSQKFRRPKSTSSSLYSQQSGVYTNGVGVQRTLSNETNLTDLGSPSPRSTGDLTFSAFTAESAII